MNYIDAFSGVGGFSEGIRRAGIAFKWHGFSEVDRYAKSVYRRHFSDTIDLGDIRAIDLDGLPDIDLFTFGFPCTDLSVAGQRQGLAGKRSSLFYEAMRVVRGKLPKIFVFENVTGLYSSADGADFTAVLREIASLGVYECQWQTLNSRWLLPQNRERIFFVGCLRGTGRRQVFPFTESDAVFTKGRGKGKRSDILPTITSNYKRGVHGCGEPMIQVGNIDTKGHNSIWGRVYSPEGCSATINSEGGGLGAKTGLYEVQRYPLKYPNRNQKNIEGDYAFTVDGANTGGIKNETGIRRLTPLEVERLQGFDDGWTEFGVEGEKISDAQRYKMCGNAVSVPIVQVVMERIFERDKP